MLISSITSFNIRLALFYRSSSSGSSKQNANFPSYSTNPHIILLKNPHPENITSDHDKDISTCSSNRSAIEQPTQKDSEPCTLHFNQDYNNIKSNVAILDVCDCKLFEAVKNKLKFQSLDELISEHPAIVKKMVFYAITKNFNSGFSACMFCRTVFSLEFHIKIDKFFSIVFKNQKLKVLSSTYLTVLKILQMITRKIFYSKLKKDDELKISALPTNLFELATKTILLIEDVCNYKNNDVYKMILEEVNSVFSNSEKYQKKILDSTRAIRQRLNFIYNLAEFYNKILVIDAKDEVLEEKIKAGEFEKNNDYFNFLEKSFIIAREIDDTMSGKLKNACDIFEACESEEIDAIETPMYIYTFEDPNSFWSNPICKFVLGVLAIFIYAIITAIQGILSLSVILKATVLILNFALIWLIFLGAAVYQSLCKSIVNLLKNLNIKK